MKLINPKHLFTLLILITTFIISACSTTVDPVSNDTPDNSDNDYNQTVQIPNDELTPEDPSTQPNNGKLKAIDCTPEQRNAEFCIEIYQPVCGQVQIQCITTPCDPIKETFANSCKACSNPNVISYTEGECYASDDIKR